MPPVDRFLSDIGVGALSTAVALPPGPSDTDGPAAQLYQRLDQEITTTNDQTLALIKDNWQDFAGQLHEADNLIARLDDEDNELAALELLVDGPDAFLPPLAAHLEQQQSLAASHLVTTASVSLLSALVAFHTTTASLAAATTSGALTSAIEALARVTSAVEDGADEWIEQTDAWKALVRWAGEEELRLEAALQGALEGCFELVSAPSSGGTTSLALRERIAAAPAGPELPVQELVQGLEDLASITGRQNQTEAFLARLAKQVLRHFVAPFLEANGRIVVGEAEAYGRGDAKKPRLAFGFRNDGKAHVATLAPAGDGAQADTVNALSDFLAFFTAHSSLFPAPGTSAKPSKYAATLTAHLTPSLQSHIISSHLSPSLPASTSALPTYLELVSAASTFEASFLPAHGFFAFLPSALSSSSREVEEQRVIRTWAARVPHHWARQAGDRALARVRAAVKAWDWGEGEMVDVEVREEDEMLGLLLGLGLADDAQTPKELALQTVPRGAKREMTMEEALAPKAPRAVTPPPPPPPPAPAPAPVESEPRAQTPPLAVQRGKGALKRGKLGAARIVSPLPPRSPSPPPLFQGGDAPTATAPGPSVSASAASPAPEERVRVPAAPEPHALDLANVISPVLSPRGPHTTFELLEEPALTLDGIGTTADHAHDADVEGPHSYAAEVKDEVGDEEAAGPAHAAEAGVKVEDADEHVLPRPDGAAEEDVKPRLVVKEESVEPEIPPTPSPALVTRRASPHSPSLGLKLSEPSPAASEEHEDDVKPAIEDHEREAAAPFAVQPHAIDVAHPPALSQQQHGSYAPPPPTVNPYAPPPPVLHPYAPPLPAGAPAPAPYAPSPPPQQEEFSSLVDAAAEEPYAPEQDPYAPAAEGERASAAEAYEEDDEAHDPYPAAPAPLESHTAAPPAAHDSYVALAEAQDLYAAVEPERALSEAGAGADGDDSHDPYAPPRNGAPESHDPYAPVGTPQDAGDQYAPAASESYVARDDVQGSYAAPADAGRDPYAAPAGAEQYPYTAPAEAEQDPYAAPTDAKQDSVALVPAAHDPFATDPYAADVAEEDWYAQEEGNDWYAQQEQAYTPAAHAHDPYAPQAPAAREEPAHDPYGPVHEPYAPHSAEPAQHQNAQAHAPQYDHDAYAPIAHEPKQSTPAPPGEQTSPVRPPEASPPVAPSLPLPPAVPPPPRSVMAPPPQQARDGAAPPPPPRVAGAAPPPRTLGRAAGKKRQVYTPQYDLGSSASTPAHAAPLSSPFQKNAAPPPRTVISPPPAEQQQNPYAPMVPPIQPAEPSPKPYTPTLSTRSSSNSLARSLPSRPTSAQRNDGPVLNHIQQRFASPPPRQASPYVPLVAPPVAPQTSYLPANDPLFADLFGSSGSKASQPANFFAPDPPQRSPAQTPVYGGAYGESHQGYGRGYDAPDAVEELRDEYTSGYGAPQNQQQQSYGQYNPYSYEQPAMRMRGGGGATWDSEDEDEEERPVLRLRGGADLGEMDDDDGNRSADDWGLNDDLGGEDDAWGLSDDVVAPSGPPSPPAAPNPAPSTPRTTARTAPYPVSPPPARPPTFATPPRFSHAASASIASIASSTGSLSRSRPPSYAYSPSLAPPSIPASSLAGAVDEPEDVGDDAWGFDADVEAPPSPQPPAPASPRPETEQPAPLWPAPTAEPPAPRSPSPQLPSPPPTRASLELEAPSAGVVDLDMPGDDSWGFGLEDGGVAGDADDLAELQVVAEQPADFLEYEQAVEQAEAVRRSPPPPAVADEVVDEEHAPSPQEVEPLEDEGWGLDETAEEAPVELEPYCSLESQLEVSTPVGHGGEPGPIHEDDAAPDVPSPPPVRQVDSLELQDPDLTAFPLDTPGSPTEPHEHPVEPPQHVREREDFEGAGSGTVEAEQPDKDHRTSFEVNQTEHSALNLPAGDIAESFPSLPPVDAHEMPHVPAPLPHHDQPEAADMTPTKEADLVDFAAGPVDDAAQFVQGNAPEDDWGLGGEEPDNGPAELAPVNSFFADAKEADAQDEQLPMSATLFEPQPAGLDDDFVDFSTPVEAVEKPAPQQWEPFEDPGNQPIISPPLNAQKPSHHDDDDDDDVILPIARSVPLADIDKLLSQEPPAQEAAVAPVHAEPSVGAPPAREGSMSSPEVIKHADAWGLEDGEQGGAEVLETGPQETPVRDGVQDSVVQHELERPTLRDDSAVQHEEVRPLIDDSVAVPGVILPAQDAHPQERTFSPPLSALPGVDAGVDHGWDWQDEAGAEILHDDEVAVTEEGPVPIPAESTIQHEDERLVVPSDGLHAALPAETAHPQERTFSPPLSALPGGDAGVDHGWDWQDEAGAEILHDDEVAVTEEGPVPIPAESTIQHEDERLVVPSDGLHAALPAETAHPQERTFSPPLSALPGGDAGVDHGWDWQDEAGAEILHDDEVAVTEEGPVPIPAESTIQHEDERLVVPSDGLHAALPAETAHPQERTFSPPLSALPGGDAGVDHGWDWQDEAGAEILHDDEVAVTEEGPVPIPAESTIQHEDERLVVPSDGLHAPLPAETAHPQERTLSPPLSALPGGDAGVDHGWDWQDEAGAEILHDDEVAVTEEGPVSIPGESTVRHEDDCLVVPSDGLHAVVPAETARLQERTFSPPPSSVPELEDQGWSFGREDDGAELLHDQPALDIEPGAKPIAGGSSVQHITERPVAAAIPADGEPLAAELSQPQEHTFSPSPSALPFVEPDVVDDTFDDPWDLEPVEPASSVEPSNDAPPTPELLDASLEEPAASAPPSTDSSVQHIEYRPHLDDAPPALPAKQSQPQQHTFDSANVPLPEVSAGHADDTTDVLEVESADLVDEPRDPIQAAVDPLDYAFNDSPADPPAAEVLDAEKVSRTGAHEPAAKGSIVQHERDRPIVHAGSEVAASHVQPQQHTFSLPTSSVPAENAPVAAAANPVAFVTPTPVEADEGWGWDGEDAGTTAADRTASTPPVLASTPPSALSTRASAVPATSTRSDLQAPAPQHARSMSADDWSWDAEEKDLKTDDCTPAPRPTEPHAETDDPPEAPAPVRREKMMVSKQSREIVAIAEEILLEAVKVTSPSFEHPGFAPAAGPLLQTFISLLSLYRATAAVHNSRLLASVPAIGMQFANDAEWIGREVERIWRTATDGKQLPVEQTQANEVHLAIESTRQLGKDTRQKQIAIQRAALMESLDEAGGFLRTSDEARFESCERALQQVTHILQRLALVWKPVMTPTSLYTTLGGLINEVLLRVLDEIEEQTDISEAESIRLNKLCKMLHELESLFDGSGTSVGRESPSWYKFVFLSELLEASMADILFLFDHGHLVDFTPQEIVRLVRALFADSPLRNRNIEKILRGHPTAPPDEEEWGAVE